MTSTPKMTVTVSVASPSDCSPLSPNRATKDKIMSSSNGSRRKMRRFVMICTTCTMAVVSLIALSNSMEYYYVSYRSNKLLIVEPSSSSSLLIKKRSPTEEDTIIKTIPTSLEEEVIPNQPLCSTIHSNSNNDATSQHSIVEHDYRKGSWVFKDDKTNDASSVLFPYFGGKDEVWGPHCTALERQYNETGIIPDYLKYDWQPHNCHLLKFHKERFCNAIANQTIGIIGDSISQQFAHSIIGMIHGALIQDESEFLIPPTWNNKLTVPLCAPSQQQPTNTAKLVFLRHNKYVAQDPQSKLSLEEIVDISDYLIINWGVHYQPWNEMDNAVNEFVQVLETKWTSSNYKQPNNLFWRSTIVAHSNCSTAIIPDENDNNLGSSSSFNIHNNPKYNTNEILLQDVEIVQRKLRSSPVLNMTFLDVTTSTMLRRDGHRIIGHRGTEDCLHYCEPGPIDTWVDLFYHHVLMLNTKTA